jgi:hypothetical protein
MHDRFLLTQIIGLPLRPIKPARFEQPPFSQRRATARVVTAPFARGRRDVHAGRVLNLAEADIVPIGLCRLRRCQRRTARLIRRHLARDGNWRRPETSRTPGIYPPNTLLTHARSRACGSSLSCVISVKIPEGPPRWSRSKTGRFAAKGASPYSDVVSKWPTAPPRKGLFRTSSVCRGIGRRTGRVNATTECILSRVRRLDDGRFGISAARPRIDPRALQTWGENPNFRFAFNPDVGKNSASTA